MAYTGTVTTSILKSGQFHAEFAGFKADAENSTVVDIFDAIQESDGRDITKQKAIPKYANFWVTAAHATAVTDTVSIFLHASVDGNTYTSLGEITDADLPNTGTTTGYSAVVAATTFPTLAYRYFKAVCTTVGVGNTLKLIANIW